MATIFSTKQNNNTINLALLLLRVIFGLTMLFHGYNKLVNFTTMSQSDFWTKDINFLGLGGAVSLGLVVFAEFFCALFLIIGLATRPALLVLIFCMAYALFATHKGQIFEYGKDGNLEGLESSFLYLVYYGILLLTGAGSYSVDKFLFKNK